MTLESRERVLSCLWQAVSFAAPPADGRCNAQITKAGSNTRPMESKPAPSIKSYITLGGY